MHCRDCREALSALIDGEAPTLAPEQVALHLDGCAGCVSWHEAAITLAAECRRSTPAAASDIVATVMAALPKDELPGPPGLSFGAMRLGLLVSGLALGLLATHHGLQVPHGVGAHEANEFGASQLGLALGFLFAAWRPARSRGMLPLTAFGVGSLALTSGPDLLANRVSLGHESTHLLALSGLLLMWAVAHDLSRRAILVLR